MKPSMLAPAVIPAFRRLKLEDSSETNLNYTVNLKQPGLQYDILSQKKKQSKEAIQVVLGCQYKGEPTNKQKLKYLDELLI